MHCNDLRACRVVVWAIFVFRTRKEGSIFSPSGQGQTKCETWGEKDVAGRERRGKRWAKISTFLRPAGRPVHSENGGR